MLARFPTILLALALVAGWPVPAFAESAGEFENPFQTDNSVGFVLNEASGRPVYGIFDTDGTLTNSGAGSMALVLRFQVSRKPGQVQVNARDVRSISARGMTIVMNDGKVYTVRHSMPSILVCDSTGACKNPVYRTSKYYANEDIARMIFYRDSGSQSNLGGAASRSQFTQVPLGPRDFFESHIRVLWPEELHQLKSAIRAEREASETELLAKAEADRTEKLARQQAEKAEHDLLRTNTETLRRTVKIGDQTNCGAVFDVRRPMIGVQTIMGMQYLRLDTIFAPGAPCRFVDGRYVPPPDL
jgi:hypothetical protein